ncbi:MAG TPA: hypothetical protein VER10_14810, partial [Mycobacterium sp.]|nr:hypothetical protein [Mycobacterium sp.]
MQRDRWAFREGHEVAVPSSLRRSAFLLIVALVAGVLLAFVVGRSTSEAASTDTTTPTTTETVTSTVTTTSTTTTTATAPTQTTTVTETKTATPTISNHTTTVETAPATQTANNSSSTVPTWAWVVIGLEALAIVGLIVMIVRERDMRQLAEQRMADREQRMADRGSYGGAPGYSDQES